MSYTLEPILANCLKLPFKSAEMKQGVVVSCWVSVPTECIAGHTQDFSTVNIVSSSWVALALLPVCGVLQRRPPLLGCDFSVLKFF